MLSPVRKKSSRSNRGGGARSRLHTETARRTGRAPRARETEEPRASEARPSTAGSPGMQWPQRTPGTQTSCRQTRRNLKRTLFERCLRRQHRVTGFSRVGSWKHLFLGSSPFCRGLRLSRTGPSAWSPVAKPSSLLRTPRAGRQNPRGSRASLLRRESCEVAPGGSGVLVSPLRQGSLLGSDLPQSLPVRVEERDARGAAARDLEDDALLAVAIHQVDARRRRDLCSAYEDSIQNPGQKSGLTGRLPGSRTAGPGVNN